MASNPLGFRPSLESLDGRIVPATGVLAKPIPTLQFAFATANFEQTTGTLTVNGTDRADDLSLTEANGTVTVNGVGLVTGNPYATVPGYRVNQIAASQVKAVVINGNGGDDRLSVRDLRGTFDQWNSNTKSNEAKPRSVTVNGGAGNETITGGAANSTLNGDAGNDTIDGGDGNERITGGAGNDVLRGNGGNDASSGGVGNDLLNGGAGNDVLDGEAGNDRLFGGDGDDKMSGGDGDDWMTGDAGNDSMDGGNGADELLGGWGNDVLAGVEGDDRLDGQGGRDLLSGGGGQNVIVSSDADGDILVGNGAFDIRITRTNQPIVERTNTMTFAIPVGSTDAEKVKFDKVAESVAKDTVKFFEKNGKAIKDGTITGKQIGEWVGVTFIAAVGADKIPGLGPILARIGQQGGQYYGVALQELYNVLKSDSTASKSEVIGTLGAITVSAIFPVHIIAHAAVFGGEKFWNFMKGVGRDFAAGDLVGAGETAGGLFGGLFEDWF